MLTTITVIVTMTYQNLRENIHVFKLRVVCTLFRHLLKTYRKCIRKQSVPKMF